MTYCGERLIVKGDTRKKTAVSLRCRSWKCPDCQPTRRDGLMAQAIGGAPRIFLTLTLKRSMASTPESAAKMLTRSWRLLRLRIMRKYGWRKLPFIAVFEPHESGWPHMHLLLRCSFIPWKWLKENWIDICGSSHVHIRFAKNRQQSAAYCCKYAGKGAEKFGTCRRYWMSQDYDLRPESKKFKKNNRSGEWVAMKRQLWLWIRDWQDRGWCVDQQSTHRAVARAPP